MSGTCGRGRAPIVRRLATAAVVVTGTTFSAGAAVVATSSSAAHAAGLTVNESWKAVEPDVTHPNVTSPPMVANVGGRQAVVFGDQAGNVYALDLDNGGRLLWTAHSAWAGDAVDGPISQSGNFIFFPVGTWGNPAGGYQAVNATTGATVWTQTISLTPTGNPPGNEGVIAGLTVSNLGPNGGTNVFAGSLGQMADSLNAGNGAVLPGFPWFQGDTNSSTAAIAVGPQGTNEIVMGGSQTGNAALNLPQGGHVRVLNGAGQYQCNYATQQPVYSSPAVGHFLAGGAMGIAASTTYLYPGVSQNNDLMGFNMGCGLVWDRPLPGNATGSPIVVDALGNGGLQVADTSYNTQALTSNGTLTLVNGATGDVLWTAPTPGASLGGPVSVDLGGGYQDFVVAGTSGAEIVDGASGKVIWTASDAPASQNMPLVTDDGNGSVGITLTGYTGVLVNNQVQLESEAAHYEIANSNGSLVHEAGGWPEFHHDTQLSGNAGNAALPYEKACSAPPRPNGYIIVTRGGEVYPFGNIPFCGSAINIPLGAGHIVGAALTPDGGGYYLVGDNGGLFTFGDAKFYGAASQYHPKTPIVGMATTSAGGYYEVTQAGGLFNFGPTPVTSTAPFYGSGASYPGGTPVVGEAIYPNGGYWEARSGGGLLAFNAPYYGAATGTATPVVAVAAAMDGSGYWEFTSGGGVFTYGAPQVGTSTGNPVVAAATDPVANGFWQVGPTGAVFGHGAAAYLGGRNSVKNEYPVTAIAGI